MTSRPSTAAPILAVIAIVLPFALYVGGYFWLGTRGEVSDGKIVLRVYPGKWLATAFGPAAYLESRLSGRTVMTFERKPSDDGWQSYPIVAGDSPVPPS